MRPVLTVSLREWTNTIAWCPFLTASSTCNWENSSIHHTKTLPLHLVLSIYKLPNEPSECIMPLPYTTWAEVASLEGQGKRTWSPYMHLRWWGFVWRSVPAFSGLIFKFKPKLQFTIFKSDVYKFKFRLELENRSKTIWRPKHPPV